MHSPFTNFERLNSFLERAGLDAVIGTSPENVLYLSGFWAMTQWVRRSPQTYVLHPANGRGSAAIATSSGLLDLVSDQQLWVTDVRRFGFFQIDKNVDASLSSEDTRQYELMSEPMYKGPVDALASIIEDNGLSSGRIGIDEGGIAHTNYEELVAKFPNAKFVRAAGLLQKVRSVKTTEEIARLQRAASITEGAIAAALAIAADGVSEMEFQREFHAFIVRNDGLPVSTCIGFGDRSAMSNAQPSDKRLRDGDVIRFDVGGRYKHYRSDISRIAFFGEPCEKLRRYHNALHAGVSRAYEVIKPGVRVGDLFDAVMKAVHDQGLPHYKRSHVGHGIGIDGYDHPSIEPSSDDLLEEGMVLCVETPYYELGFAGLQVEDMLLVTNHGAKSMMTTSGALQVIG